MHLAGPDRTRFVERAFWIALGRAPSPEELTRGLEGLHEGTRTTLVINLVTQPEAVRLRAGWASGQHTRDPHELERGLRSLGSHESFVASAYEVLLGRRAEDSGLQHHAAALAKGDRRLDTLHNIVRSDEFQRRAAELLTFGRVPRDVQLCELANPAKWDNPEWLEILRSVGHTDDKTSMHRKAYEFAQLVFGCRRLGVLTEEARVVSIGAGHEQVLYWLANHVGDVIATDMYGGAWNDARGHEGDPFVMTDPDLYAPFPYRRDRLRFLEMDGRSLAFRDGSFDIAYSLSSIEHFGGLDGAAAAVREMGRVLRPGGILVLATEYVLSGPPHDETFQPNELHRLLRQPGLELVEPIDERVYQRYESSIVDLYTHPYQSPHMVVRFGETVFTTVMVFLRKR
jgi:SAM-dependent methyltransferase